MIAPRLAALPFALLATLTGCTTTPPAPIPTTTIGTPAPSSEQPSSPAAPTSTGAPSTAAAPTSAPVATPSATASATAPPSTPAATALECPDIAFETNSENAAFGITATGTTCAAADKLVRAVAAAHNFYSGPRAFSHAGYACTVKTLDADIPQGRYRCAKGAVVIAWVKS